MKIDSVYLGIGYGTFKTSEGQSQIETKLTTQEIIEWLEVLEPLIRMKLTEEKRKIAAAVLQPIRPIAEIEGEVQ